MKNTTAKHVAFLGVMFALIFLLMLLETFVFNGIIGLPTCFLSLPVAITLSVFSDYKYCFFGGTAFGLCSFIISFIIGNPFFYNPLVSVLPRVLIGITAYFSCTAVLKLTKSSANKIVKRTFPFAVAGIVGVITNTVFTILMLCIFNNWGYISTLLGTVMAIDFLPEFIASIVLVPVYMHALSAAKFTDKLNW